MPRKANPLQIRRLYLGGMLANATGKHERVDSP